MTQRKSKMWIATMAIVLVGLVFGFMPMSTPSAEAFPAVERCFPIGDGCFFCYSIIVLPDGTVKTSTWRTC